MAKNKKRILASLAAFIIIAALLHFVPFDDRTGYLDKGMGNLCIGYLQPVELNYRWITGGVNTWDDQLSYLKEGSLNQAQVSCAEPVHIRLYIL